MTAILVMAASVVTFVRIIILATPKFPGENARCVIVLATGRILNLETVIPGLESVSNVFTILRDSTVSTVRPDILEMLWRECVTLVPVTCWALILIGLIVTVSQENATVYLMLKEIIVILVLNTIGKLLLVRAVKLVPVIPMVPLDLPVTCTWDSVTASLGSEGGSATNARRTSMETPGLSVYPATVILWAWTRTGHSVTGGQETASVWKVFLVRNVINVQ